MSWPTFVGVSSVVEVTGTAHALVTTGISGLASGDLMIACIVSRIASTTSITLPAGWTLVAEQKVNDIVSSNLGRPSAMMAYHIRGASNPSLTFTHPVAPSVALGRIVAYRNIDAAAVLDAQTAFTTGTNVTAVSGAGLTTTTIEDLIVAMAAGGQEAAWASFNATDPAGASGASVTTPPGIAWSERADSVTVTGADASLGIFDAVKRSPGATGNLTVTASVAAAHAVIAAAFRIVNASGTTLDPNKTSSLITLSNANRTATRSTGTAMYATTLSTSSSDATIMYVEATHTTGGTNSGIGVSNRPIADSDAGGTTNWLGWDGNSIGIYNHEIYHGGALVSSLSSVPNANDTIAVYVDRTTSPSSFRARNVTKAEAWAPPFTGSGIDISTLGTGPLYFGFTLSNPDAKTVNFSGPFGDVINPPITTWDGTPVNPIHYTMPAAVGARTLTGFATILARSRIMAADTGARVVAFIDAGLNRGFRMVADIGTFALTGIAADLIRATVAAYTLVADTVAFTLVGTAAGSLRTRVLEAVQGTVTLAGSAAGFIRTHIMAAAQGAVVLTGYAAGLVTIGAKVMLASTGALLLDGTATALRHARWMLSDLGALLLTGRDVNLVYTAAAQHYTLAATSGMVTLGLSPAVLVYVRGVSDEQQPGPMRWGTPVYSIEHAISVSRRRGRLS